MFNIENVKISEKWLFCDFNIYNLGWVIRKNSYLKVISITFLDRQEYIKYLWSSDLTKIEPYLDDTKTWTNFQLSYVQILKSEYFWENVHLL